MIWLNPNGAMSCFKWTAGQEIEPIIIPVPAEGMMVDMGISYSYEVEGLPKGVDFDVVKRKIFGRPSDKDNGIAKIYVKNHDGKVFMTCDFVWEVVSDEE